MRFPRSTLIATSIVCLALAAPTPTMALPQVTPMETVTAATSITAKTPLKSAQPTIAGKAITGKRLTAKPGKWTPGTSFTYTWSASGKKIAGEIGKTLLITAKLVGKRITVTVTGRLPGYATASMTSRASSIVARAVTKPVKEFANCAELHKVYPHGVGRVGAIDRTSGHGVTDFTRNNKLYELNQKSDRDGDGIACEA